MTLSSGNQIGQFRIERELGRGGMGVVYLAEDTKLERQVAIKSLPPEFVKHAEAQSRFQREAKLLASLNHPNIATIYDIIEGDEGAGYLVLECIPGETLTERIARGPIELQQALSIACQVADAIVVAHEHGVIHRDLKPGNIKITPEGTVKVLDFGLAKMTGIPTPDGPTVTLTQPGQTVGTPAYMSPEQARGNPADRRTDIWSFGCILFEMLSGQRPFPGKTATEVIASVLKSEPDWAAIPAEAGPNLRKIVERCLKKEPDARYQSAAELCRDLRQLCQALTQPAPKAINLKAFLPSLRKPRVAIPVFLVVATLCVGAAFVMRRNAKVRWARLKAIPQITDLIKEDKYPAAFSLAKEVERHIPNDAMLARLWPEMSRHYSIVTTPPGANILYKEYSDVGGPWLRLGRSPRESIRFPLGVYRWMIAKPGFEPMEFVDGDYSGSPTLELELREEDNDWPAMVLIGARTFRVQSSEALDSQEVKAPRYLIDKFEVTNEEYKTFVDADGYKKREFWKHEFVKEGRELSWQEAMDEFQDSTARPGPKTWEGGTYPEGKEKHPVSGVSWYEANAYAAFVGKSLPTIYHWRGAARFPEAQVIIPYSNFGMAGTAPRGSYKGIGSAGVYDMAGNVKEWCWNAADVLETRRYILGGSWGEPTYMFSDPDSQSPWERKATFGFRCVLYFQGGESVPDALFAPAVRRIRDFADVSPISDELFESWLRDWYSFVRAEPKAVLATVDENSLHWRKEKIRFDAAYGGEEIVAYLFLPKGVSPPYQPVIYFPGIGATWPDSSETLADFQPLSFVIKSGRAVLYPVYKGTYERKFGNPPTSDKTGTRDWVIQLSKDLRRSVDYLWTRRDIDTEKLTYYGFSWGAVLGPVMVAIEDRIQFAVFLDGGFWINHEVLPSVDAVSFAPRVKVPVLMVNGREDFTFPYKSSQEPMYRLLGSDDKEHSLHPGGHGLFGLFTTRIKDDVLKWLDDHLGTVQ